MHLLPFQTLQGRWVQPTPTPLWWAAWWVTHQSSAPPGPYRPPCPLWAHQWTAWPLPIQLLHLPWARPLYRCSLLPTWTSDHSAVHRWDMWGCFGRQKITMNCYFPKWLEYKVAFMYPWNYHDRIIIIFCIYIWNVCSSFTIPCQSELLRQVKVKKICTTQNPIWKYQRMCFEAEFVCFKVVKNANTTC